MGDNITNEHPFQQNIPPADRCQLYSTYTKTLKKQKHADSQWLQALPPVDVVVNGLVQDISPSNLKLCFRALECCGVLLAHTAFVSRIPVPRQKELAQGLVDALCVTYQRRAKDAVKMALYALTHQQLLPDVMAGALEHHGVDVLEGLQYPNPPFKTLSVPLFALGMLVPLCTQVPQFAQQHVQVLFQRLWELMMVIPDTVAHNATQGNAPSQEDILQLDQPPAMRIRPAAITKYTQLMPTLFMQHHDALLPWFEQHVKYRLCEQWRARCQLCMRLMSASQAAQEHALVLHKDMARCWQLAVEFLGPVVFDKQEDIGKPMIKAWMHMYELRGLPLSSVVFIAWTTLAARAVECGHMHEFRRLLMQPVYAHVHYAVKHYNDSDDLDNLCMPAMSTWKTLLQACATTTNVPPNPTTTCIPHPHRVLLDDAGIAEVLLDNMLRLCLEQQLPEVDLGVDASPAPPCHGLLKHVLDIMLQVLHTPVPLPTAHHMPPTPDSMPPKWSPLVCIPASMCSVLIPMVTPHDGGASPADVMNDDSMNLLRIHDNDKRIHDNNSNNENHGCRHNVHATIQQQQQLQVHHMSNEDGVIIMCSILRAIMAAWWRLLAAIHVGVDVVSDIQHMRACTSNCLQAVLQRVLAGTQTVAQDTQKAVLLEIVGLLCAQLHAVYHLCCDHSTASQPFCVDHRTTTHTNTNTNTNPPTHATAHTAAAVDALVGCMDGVLACVWNDCADLLVGGVLQGVLTTTTGGWQLYTTTSPTTIPYTLHPAWPCITPATLQVAWQCGIADAAASAAAPGLPLPLGAPSHHSSSHTSPSHHNPLATIAPAAAAGVIVPPPSHTRAHHTPHTSTPARGAMPPPPPAAPPHPHPTSHVMVPPTFAGVFLTYREMMMLSPSVRTGYGAVAGGNNAAAAGGGNNAAAAGGGNNAAAAAAGGGDNPAAAAGDNPAAGGGMHNMDSPHSSVQPHGAFHGLCNPPQDNHTTPVATPQPLHDHQPSPQQQGGCDAPNSQNTPYHDAGDHRANQEGVGSAKTRPQNKRVHHTPRTAARGPPARALVLDSTGGKHTVQHSPSFAGVPDAVQQQQQHEQQKMQHDKENRGEAGCVDDTAHDAAARQQQQQGHDAAQQQPHHQTPMLHAESITRAVSAPTHTDSITPAPPAAAPPAEEGKAGGASTAAASSPLRCLLTSITTVLCVLRPPAPNTPTATSHNPAFDGNTTHSRSVAQLQPNCSMVTAQRVVHWCQHVLTMHDSMGGCGGYAVSGEACVEVLCEIIRQWCGGHEGGVHDGSGVHDGVRAGVHGGSGRGENTRSDAQSVVEDCQQQQQQQQTPMSIPTHTRSSPWGVFRVLSLVIDTMQQRGVVHKIPLHVGAALVGVTCEAVLQGGYAECSTAMITTTTHDNSNNITPNPSTTLNTLLHRLTHPLSHTPTGPPSWMEPRADWGSLQRPATVRSSETVHSMAATENAQVETAQRGTEEAGLRSGVLAQHAQHDVIVARDLMMRLGVQVTAALERRGEGARDVVGLGGAVARIAAELVPCEASNSPQPQQPLPVDVAHKTHTKAGTWWGAIPPSASPHYAIAAQLATQWLNTCPMHPAPTSAAHHTSTAAPDTTPHCGSLDPSCVQCLEVLTRALQHLRGQAQRAQRAHGVGGPQQGDEGWGVGGRGALVRVSGALARVGGVAVQEGASACGAFRGAVAAFEQLILFLLPDDVTDNDNKNDNDKDKDIDNAGDVDMPDAVNDHDDVHDNHDMQAWYTAIRAAQPHIHTVARALVAAAHGGADGAHNADGVTHSTPGGRLCARVDAMLGVGKARGKQIKRPLDDDGGDGGGDNDVHNDAGRDNDDGGVIESVLAQQEHKDRHRHIRDDEAALLPDAKRTCIRDDSGGGDGGGGDVHDGGTAAVPAARETPTAKAGTATPPILPQPILPPAAAAVPAATAAAPLPPTVPAPIHIFPTSQTEYAVIPRQTSSCVTDTSLMTDHQREVAAARRRGAVAQGVVTYSNMDASQGGTQAPTQGGGVLMVGENVLVVQAVQPVQEVQQALQATSLPPQQQEQPHNAQPHNTQPHNSQHESQRLRHDELALLEVGCTQDILQGAPSTSTYRRYMGTSECLLMLQELHDRGGWAHMTKQELEVVATRLRALLATVNKNIAGQLVQ